MNELGESGRLRLGLETVAENHRDGKTLVAIAPLVTEYLDDGRGLGAGIEPDAVTADTDAHEAVNGSEFTTEGAFGLANVCHVTATVAPKRLRTDCIGLAIV